MAESLHEMTARAIRGLRRIGEFHYPEGGGVDPHPLDCCLAGRVKRVFLVGMTTANQMCRDAGEDPEFCEREERERILTIEEDRDGE